MLNLNWFIQTIADIQGELNFSFKMKTKHFRCLVTFLCGMVFILLMRDIWIKFNSNIISTGIKFTDPEDDNKLLPLLTGKFNGKKII